jgi:hypothetical protein
MVNFAQMLGSSSNWASLVWWLQTHVDTCFVEAAVRRISILPLFFILTY